MLHHGYLRMGRFLGVDLRVHWSVPLSAVLFTKARFEPILWLCFLVLIVVHELGHIALIRRCGFSLLGIDLTGVGGQCRYRGNASQLERALIAWGGVLAQSLLVLGALLAQVIWGAGQSRAFQLLVAINKTFAQNAGQCLAHGCFARAHQPNQKNISLKGCR